jgi:hypothetical protein
MTTTVAPLAKTQRIEKGEAPALARAEYARFLDLLKSLSDDDWTRPTGCLRWDVRGIVAHVLGWAETLTMREFMRVNRLGKPVARELGGPLIDGANEVLVRTPEGCITLGYLNDHIFTRDTWIHRVDISRATRREMVLTAGHDGRVVADVVSDWAARHRRSFTLILDGPAGGVHRSGSNGEEHHLDAVEFCRIASGRATGIGLLGTRVLF